MKNADWDTSDPNIEGLLKWFSRPFDSADDICSFASGLLLRLAREEPVRVVMTPTSYAILQHIANRPDGCDLIRELGRNIERLAGVDVINGRRLRNEIAVWLST